MEVEYFASVGIGYEIEPKRVPEQYRKHIAEQKVTPASESDDIWILGSKEYEDFGDFVGAVAAKVGGICNSWGDFEAGEQHFSIELAIPEDHYHDDRCDFRFAVKHAQKVEQIGQQLKKLGFPVGKPMILAEWWVG